MKRVSESDLRPGGCYAPRYNKNKPFLVLHADADAARWTWTWLDEWELRTTFVEPSNDYLELVPPLG